MAYKEMFFVQLFGYNSKNRLVAGAVYHANNAEHAIDRARRYSEQGAPGVIAFSQMIDEKAEDAEEPALLAWFGHVPAEARAAA